MIKYKHQNYYQPVLLLLGKLCYFFYSHHQLPCYHLIFQLYLMHRYITISYLMISYNIISLIYNYNCELTHHPSHMPQKFHTAQIHSIQLHINPSHLFTFHNTFYIQTFKHYSYDIIISIINHQHPIHPISQLPFAIINNTYIVSRYKLSALLDVLSMERQIRYMYFKPVYELCEELAGVGRIISQQPGNPYYLLLSPMNKYQVYRWNNMFKKYMYENTQYFNTYTEELNKQYYLYQLNNLSSYISKVDNNFMIIMCVYSFIKSIKIDNKKLYEIIIKDQVFKNIQQEGLKYITENKDKDIRGVRMGQPRFYATIEDEKQNQKIKEQQWKKNNHIADNIFSDNRLEFLSRLIYPTVVLGIFWKAYKSQSK